jgi:hypothetical protein
MDSIKCPHCGKLVELSEAIVHELQAQVRTEESKKLKAEFEEQKAKEQAQNEKILREEFEEQNKKRSEELEEMKRKEKVLNEKLKQEKEEREKAEEKIKRDAIKNAEEAQVLKLKEKDIQMDQIKKLAEDLRRANEDLKKKLEQGSQQLQGEALELNLEQKLKETFPNDEFVPIPKGVEGGDIWQKVKFNGKVVGSIIWETKRTKAWSKGWLTKLKEDAGKVSATEAIIVSQVLPENSSSFDRIDGVWVTTYEHALNICRFVRFLITNVSSAKSSANHTEEEWGRIRDYIMSDNFKHRMQSHFDNVNALRTSLQAEQRATTLRWKKQEDIIKKLDMNTASFYGELKTIVTNLPELEEIETPLLNDENSDQTNL